MSLQGVRSDKINHGRERQPRAPRLTDLDESVSDAAVPFLAQNVLGLGARHRHLAAGGLPGRAFRGCLVARGGSLGEWMVKRVNRCRVAVSLKSYYRLYICR